MILGLGVLGCSFILVLLLACLRVSGGMPGSPKAATLWGLSVVLLIIALFRPEEEIEIGEDPGVYFNSALSFVQQGALHFPDPALSEIPTEDRPLFRYGHEGFMITKDNSLWADDLSMSEVGAFFLPGYALLLAVPMSLGFAYGAFWISPLLAIMTGVLVALWARWLVGRGWAAPVAFALYILSPVVFWNARCVRAEWPASFLALAGITLLVAHTAMGKRLSLGMSCLAGLALAAASWFHVTALYVLLPALVLAVWNSKRESFWIGWWTGVGVGLALLAAQLIWVSDPYWILSNLLAPGRRLLFLLSIVIMAGAVVIVRVGWLKVSTRFRLNRARWGQVGGALMAAVFLVAVFFVLRFRGEQGQLPGLPAWTASYISLTDFEGVHRLWSRSTFFLAVIGMFSLCVRTGVSGRLGRWFFLLLAPASLTVGWVFNYMFETRRMVTFLAPLLTIALVSLLASIESAVASGLKRRRLPVHAELLERLVCVVPILLSVLILAVWCRGRIHLYTTWNYQGLYGYYQSVSERVAQTSDFIFGEYTQTTIPVERLSGVPALPLAWGYRTESEYRMAERVFERLVHEHPERRHVLITPFSGVALPGMTLEPLFEATVESRRVGRARQSVPTEVHSFERTLRTYRVHLPSAEINTFPYRRLMDGGLLGLSGAVNRMPHRSIELRGIPVLAASPLQPSALIGAQTETKRVLLVFSISAADEDAAQVHVIATDPDVIARRFQPCVGWVGVELLLSPDIGVGDWTMHFEEQAYLTDGFAVEDAGAIRRINLPIEQTESFTLHGIDSQWMRASAAMALPVDGATRRLWMLATRGRTDQVRPRVSVRPRADGAAARSFDMEEGWSWHVVPMDPVSEGGMQWHDMDVSPAWDPELRNFPSDLGVWIHCLYVD